MKKNIINILVGFIFFLSIFCYSIYNLDKLEMHIDEHEWLRRSMLLFDVGFIKRNFQDDIWTDFISIDQSNLAEYFYGFWTYLIYNKRDLIELTEKLQFNHPYVGKYSENYSDIWNGNNWWIKYSYIYNARVVIPSQYHLAYDLIVYNRYLSVIFFVATAILVFFIVKEFFSVQYAYLSSFLYVVLPLHQIHSRQAMLGSIITFFITLSLLVFIKLKSLRYFKTWQIFLLGMVTGLTAAARLDGFVSIILVSIILFIEMFFDLFRENDSSIKESKLMLFRNWIISAFTLLSVCFFVFYLLNPFVWEKPIENLTLMFESRQEYTTQELAIELTPELALKTYQERFGQVFINMATPFFKEDQYFLYFIQVANFSFGMCFLFIKSFFRKDNRKYLRIFLYIVGLFLIMTLYIVLNYKRYYLPILPMAAIIHAIGIYALVSFLKAKHGFKLYTRNP